MFFFNICIFSCSLKCFFKLFVSVFETTLNLNPKSFICVAIFQNYNFKYVNSAKTILFQKILLQNCIYLLDCFSFMLNGHF